MMKKASMLVASRLADIHKLSIEEAIVFVENDIAVNKTNYLGIKGRLKNKERIPESFCKKFGITMINVDYEYMYEEKLKPMQIISIEKERECEEINKTMKWLMFFRGKRGFKIFDI